MTAKVTLLCGPAGSGKTIRLLERFRACAASAPNTALWLGPTPRAVEALRPRLVPAAGGIGAPPLTFQDFLEEVIRRNDPRARPLSRAHQRLLLEELLAGLEARGRLGHFARVRETRGFLDGLLGFVAEMRQNGVEPPDLARAVRSSRTAPGARVRECARIYARYRDVLRRRHLYDLEGRAQLARELLRAGRRNPFTALRALFVDDFTDFTPLQIDILQDLGGWVEEIWITLPDEAGDRRAELFTRSRATLQRLRAQLPVGKPDVLKPGCAETPPPLPRGLAHLQSQLFLPLRQIEVGEDAAGIVRLEAPGMLGEARMVARRIKTLLLRQVAPDDVVVILRDLTPYADLLREVFGEYGIPVDVEGTEPLTRNPAVSVLLRALRLPEEDWPFAGVTALLRNTFFRPDWPERAGPPEMAARAEAILRLLGEPRGREAYLAAIKRWAERQQPGLEDEQAEESRRRRTHELARQCGPFLERFFQAWDGAPARADLAEHVAWLRRLAEDLGIPCAAAEDPRAACALERLWAELDLWVRRANDLQPSGPAPMDRKTFQRRLLSLAGEATLPRTERDPGRVRILSAEVARHLAVPHVFLMGLGERGFPRLAGPPTLLDESERQALVQAGLDLPPAGDVLPEEMLLFYQAVTRARRELVLSYPAVDDRGQDLLPSSFLLALLDCFRPNATPRESRRMLIQGYDRDAPLSPAEYRVRVARGGENASPENLARLPPDLRANLAEASVLVERRFRARDYNPFDGHFRDPAVIDQVARLFGPEKVFSPTALEDYVACPFRFFLRHVLRLEPLEEPREEIEVTRRGQAFHRALARLHRALRQKDVHEPADEVAGHVLEEIRAAVAEDIHRAPSPAAKALWSLEGERLLRLAARYPEQWRKFLKPWQQRSVAPRPHFFEVDFGLPAAEGQEPFPPLVIRTAEAEVRVSGRIDRVDLVELEEGPGFWIIDYKTGSSTHYTSTDLAEFRRLQLTLYALAVEEVLLAGRSARPLGLAYWLVAESGPKVVLPAYNQVLWLEESGRWRALRERLQNWVVTLVSHIRQGIFPLRPRSEHCTQTCPFGQVCRITQARAVEKEWDLPLPGEAGL